MYPSVPLLTSPPGSRGVVLFSGHVSGEEDMFFDVSSMIDFYTVIFYAHIMTRLTKVGKAHVSTLSELFVNLSAGYIGIVLIAPLAGQHIASLTKNIILAIAFYALAVRLRVR